MRERWDEMRWCQEGRPSCIMLMAMGKRACHTEWGPQPTQWMDGTDVIHSFGENNFMEWKGKKWDENGEKGLQIVELVCLMQWARGTHWEVLWAPGRGFLKAITIKMGYEKNTRRVVNRRVLVRGSNIQKCKEVRKSVPRPDTFSTQNRAWREECLETGN